MSWNAGEDFGGANEFEGNGGVAFEGGDFGGAEGGAGGGGGGGGDQTCRICSETGHFARECPTKPAETCHNCGETGHIKKECPNPRKEGTGMCKNCQQEGHITLECKNPRKFDLSGVANKDPDTAWEDVKKADAAGDLDLIREAIKVYSKAIPDLDYVQLENAFRSQGLNTYLIAKEVELANTWTLVNLQGVLDQKFKVGYFLSPKPRRKNQAQGWPESPEENIERLKSAGLPMDRMVIRCNRCNELGHSAKNCPEDAPEVIDRVEVKCALCSEVGHRVRDCTQPRQKPMDCKNCGETGHFAKECTNPPKPMQCRNCLEEGHKATDCNNERHPDTIICRNCDEKGHLSKDCTKKKDWSRVKCSNCEQMGHGAKRCPEPNKEEAAGDMGFDAPGGDAGFDTGADAGAATFDASGGAFDSGAGDTLDTGIAVGGGGGGW